MLLLAGPPRSHGKQAGPDNRLPALGRRSFQLEPRRGGVSDPAAGARRDRHPHVLHGTRRFHGQPRKRSPRDDRRPQAGRSYYFAVFSVVGSVSLGLSPILWGILIDGFHDLERTLGAFQLNRYSLLFGLHRHVRRHRLPVAATRGNRRGKLRRSDATRPRSLPGARPRSRPPGWPRP